MVREAIAHEPSAVTAKALVYLHDTSQGLARIRTSAEDPDSGQRS